MNKKLQRLLIVIAVLFAGTVGLQQAGRIILPNGVWEQQWAVGMIHFIMFAGGCLVIYLIVNYIINGNE